MWGSLAVFEINIELNDDENRLYEKVGLVYIDELAKKIQCAPSSYSERNLPENYFDADL